MENSTMTSIEQKLDFIARSVNSIEVRIKGKVHMATDYSKNSGLPEWPEASKQTE